MKYINAKEIIKSTDKSSSEKNDCSVRAFTTALDVDYDAAHSYLKNVKDFSKGIYLVLVSGHVFTVKNGLMIDNVGEEWRPTRKVESVFELKLKNVLVQSEFEFARFC